MKKVMASLVVMMLMGAHATYAQGIAEITAPLQRAVDLATGGVARLVVVLAVVFTGFYYFMQRGGEAGKKALGVFAGAVLILAAQGLVGFFFPTFGATVLP